MTDAMNTYNSALKLIKEEGYSISIFDENDQDYSWQAEKLGFTFIASDPLRLLALITIWKVHGEGWREQNVCDYYDDILTKHFNQ